MKTYMFKLFELKDNMEKAIENLDKVKESQLELVEIVKKAKNTKTDFSEFIEGINNEISRYEPKKEEIKIKLSTVQTLIDNYSKGRLENATAEEKRLSELTDEIVSMTLLAIGAADSDE